MPGQIVLHGPGGRDDNSVRNLSWGTPRQNALDRIRDGTMLSGSRHHNTKINEKIVRDIFDMYIDGYSKRFIGAQFGVTYQNVHAILTGKTWKHIYAEKMGVPLQEVYDMWAYGQRNATRISVIHLKGLLKEGSVLVPANNVQVKRQAIFSIT